MNEAACDYETAVDWVSRRAGEELPADDNAPRLDALGLVGGYVRGDLSPPEFEERRDGLADRSPDPTLSLQVELLARGVDAVRSGDRDREERQRRYHSLARWTVEPLAERAGLPGDGPPGLDVPLVGSGDDPVVESEDLRAALDEGRPAHDVLPEEPAAVRSLVDRVNEATTTGQPFLLPAESAHAEAVDAAGAFASAATSADPPLEDLAEREAVAVEQAGEDAAPAVRRLLARAALAEATLEEDALESHPVEAAAATLAADLGVEERASESGVSPDTVDGALLDRVPDDPAPVVAAAADALADRSRPVSVGFSTVDRAAERLDDAGSVDRRAGGPGQGR